MNQNRLFNQTRRKLALSYATVMGMIISLLGLGVYRAIAKAHIVTADRELESVTGALHDSLELKLVQPGVVEPIVKELLPNLCWVGTHCSQTLESSQRHTLSAINRGYYYVRLWDTSGRLIAVSGAGSAGLSPTFDPKSWQTPVDSNGNAYHQFSTSLHTRDRRDWGYLQVGRSLKDLNDYLNTVKWILGLGLPVAILLVGVASWGLAGLAMQPIYQSYKQIQQFTADAAHELRTPVAAILATVESALLMPSLNEKEVRNILEIVERQNRRLAQLIADLLCLTRLDQQPAPSGHQRCCLQDLVGDLVEELTAIAIAAGVKLTSEMRVQAPLYAIGNEEQLYRLVSNLIVNALQYTPAGGTVTIIISKSDRYGTIQVQDTGIGIAPEERSRIFDRFYRVNRDRSRYTGGAGLGLAIAKAIALAHHGSLQVESQLGAGSLFVLRLPLYAI